MSSKSKTILFSKREREVLQLTLQEYSGIEIAERLYISPKTVEKHKTNLIKKTGSKNFIGVITYAFTRQIVLLNDLKK